MIEYKENVWYGWNGGECPVHPKSTVEVVWVHKDGSPSKKTDIAYDWMWLGNEYGDIVAFRVVKEYKEPREFWIVNGESLHSKEAAENAYAEHDFEIIHVREVLD